MFLLAARTSRQASYAKSAQRDCSASMVEGSNLPASVWLFWFLYLPSLASALWKGSPPERLGAATLCAIPGVQLGLYTWIPAAYDHVDPISAFADFVGLCGFGYLALNARRAWPIWACAFQLLAFTAHFSRSLEISGHPLIYSWMKSSPTLLAAITVLIGTIKYRRDLRWGSTEEPWMNWSELKKPRVQMDD